MDCEGIITTACPDDSTEAGNEIPSAKGLGGDRGGAVIGLVVLEPN